jgi:hypothetical protein
MNALRRCLGWRAKGAEVDSQSAPYITRLARTESKMDLEIAGISHYNPSHRKVLQNWLQVLKDHNGDTARFIAVEWAGNQFLNIALIQRRWLRDELDKVWPKAPSAAKDEIAMALGFEGDSQVGIFDRTPILWLDDGDLRDPSGYASRQLDDFKRFVEAHPTDKDASDLIDRLRQGADDLDHAKRNDRRPDRDVKFATRILDLIGLDRDDPDRDARKPDGQPKKRWGIVVVGKNHAISEVGNMLWLLEQAGHHCYKAPI